MLQHTTSLNKIPHNFVIFSAFFLKSFYCIFGDQSIKYLLFFSLKYGNKDTLDALNTILAPLCMQYSLMVK